MSISVDRVLNTEYGVDRKQSSWPDWSDERTNNPEPQISERKKTKKEYVSVLLYGPQGIGNKEYVFHTFFEVNVGSLVTVETQTGYAIGEVISLMDRLPLSLDCDVAEVIQVVDLNPLKQKKAERNLRNKMRSLLDNMDEMELFQLVAEKDQEMYDLWKQYQSFTGKR